MLCGYLGSTWVSRILAHVPFQKFMTSPLYPWTFDEYQKYPETSGIKSQVLTHVNMKKTIPAPHCFKPVLNWYPLFLILYGYL